MEKAELKELIREVIEEGKQNNTNQYMRGRYGDVRKEYSEKIKAMKGKGIPIHRAHKVIEAMRDIAKADANISYMSRASVEQLEKMADTFEVIAKAFIEYKEGNNGQS